MRPGVSFSLRVMLVVSVGCGRVGFDAHQASRDASVDATPSLDARGGTMDAFASDATISDANVAVNDGPTVVDAPPMIDAERDAGMREACANDVDDDGDLLVDLDDGDCRCAPRPRLLLGLDDASAISVASCRDFIAVAWKQETSERGIHVALLDEPMAELLWHTYLGTETNDESDPRVACNDTHVAVATTVTDVEHSLHVLESVTGIAGQLPFVSVPMDSAILGRVVRSSDGSTFVMAWWDQRGGGRGIYARSLDLMTRTFSPEVLVSTNTAFPSRPALVATPSGYVVAWLSGLDGTLRTRAFDTALTPVGADFDAVMSSGGSPFSEPFFTHGRAGFRAGWLVGATEHHGVSLDPIARTRGTVQTITLLGEQAHQIGAFRRWILAATTSSTNEAMLERYDSAESATTSFLASGATTTPFGPRFVESTGGLAMAYLDVEAGATETARPAVTLLSCPP